MVAGTGVAGYSGDGAPAVEAELNYPGGIAIGSDGTIYVADAGNNRVRAITADGLINTIAGTGARGSEGDGGPAELAEFNGVAAVAVAPDTSLLVAESEGVRRVAPDGTISTLIAGGQAAIAMPGLQNVLFPSAIAVSGSGNIFVANFSPKQLIEFSSTGTVRKVWDVYVAFGGLIGTPDGVLIADYSYRIDRVSNDSLTPIVSFALGSVPDIRLFRPAGIGVGPNGEIYASDNGVSAGNNAPVLITIDANNQPHVLDVR